METKNKSRPTPDLNIAQASKFTTRDYIRKFNDDICKIHDWICSCSENKRLYDFRRGCGTSGNSKRSRRILCAKRSQTEKFQKEKV